MKDTEFMTAKEKELVLKQWETFLRYGCEWKHFTKRLYDHLIQHCSFIAHYNRGGFYRTYFQRGDDKANFFSQFDARNAWADSEGHILEPPKSFEYGMTYWAEGDYADLNLAMIEVATKYIPVLLEEAQDQQRKADIATARLLLAKHGIEL